MKRTTDLSDSWHPDLETNLGELPYARRVHREDWLHYLKIAGLTLMLSGSGFAAVLVIRYLILG